MNRALSKSMHGEHGFAPGHALPPPDHRRRSDLPFTFMEILIAGMILTLAIAMTLGILGGARGRLLKAEQRWGRSHHLSNMTEFYLLTGPKGDLPASLLPEGFSARCDLVKAEDLPEHAAEGVPGWDDWQLGQFHVAVTAPSGNTIGKWVVEKLVREDDCD